jgi:hypothetical protein
MDISPFESLFISRSEAAACTKEMEKLQTRAYPITWKITMRIDLSFANYVLLTKITRHMYIN